MIDKIKRVFHGDREVSIGYCPRPIDIVSFVDEMFDKSLGRLSKDAHILVKPNFHKDVPAIVSNTTDFRLIITIIRSLQKRGYKNITIGEGPACGFDFSDIDVFSRLRVPQLAQHLGVNCLNFNKAESAVVHLWGNKPAHIARIVLDADYFINVPKLKTHLLSQISAALKSLVGCFVGLQKRRMHDRIIENIIRVNELFPPDLTFVDALVAMEGQGPGIGTPIVLDRVLCGKNSFTLDLACAVLSGHDLKKLKLIRLSLMKGHLNNEELSEAIEKIECLHKFMLAVPNKVVRIISLPILNSLRELVRPIFLLPIVHEILYRLEIREDHLNFDDGNVKLEFSPSPSEDDCRRCAKYCPMSVEQEYFKWPEHIREGCLECLYCVFLCRDDGVRLKGRKGFLEYLLKHYRPWTTQLD